MSQVVVVPQHYGVQTWYRVIAIDSLVQERCQNDNIVPWDFLKEYRVRTIFSKYWSSRDDLPQEYRTPDDFVARNARELDALKPSGLGTFSPPSSGAVVLVYSSVI